MKESKLKFESLLKRAGSEHRIQQMSKNESPENQISQNDQLGKDTRLGKVRLSKVKKAQNFVATSYKIKFGLPKNDPFAALDLVIGPRPC